VNWRLVIIIIITSWWWVNWRLVIIIIIITSWWWAVVALSWWWSRGDALAEASDSWKDISDSGAAAGDNTCDDLALDSGQVLAEAGVVIDAGAAKVWCDWGNTLKSTLWHIGSLILADWARWSRWDAGVGWAWWVTSLGGQGGVTAGLGWTWSWWVSWLIVWADSGVSGDSNISWLALGSLRWARSDGRGLSGGLGDHGLAGGWCWAVFIILSWWWRRGDALAESGDRWEDNTDSDILAAAGDNAWDDLALDR